MKIIISGQARTSSSGNQDGIVTHHLSAESRRASRVGERGDE